MRNRNAVWLIVPAAALSLACPSAQETQDAGAVGGVLSAESGYACAAPYVFPADLAEQSQAGADSFAWSSFLAVSAASDGPAWKDWESTVDLIECGQSEPPSDGSCVEGRYYPKACTAAYPDSYGNYVAIDQVGKVDDDFEEARTKGLSSNPVIASNGTFLRYQIMLSPGTSSWIRDTDGGLQRESNLVAHAPVNFPCGAGAEGDYSQAMSLKLAWMEMADPLPAAASNYYTQQMLVYTPSYRNSSGEESCELKTMGLVGMHLVRKTTSQPAWVWGTFEHNLNAPLCTNEPDSGYKNKTSPRGAGGVNTSCPATVDQAYNFHLQDCSGDACAACNTGYGAATGGLEQNGKPYDPGKPLPQPGVCVNPAKVGGGTPSPSWCVDQPPAASHGTSTLCRQVPPSGYGYTGSSFAETEPNKACRPTSGVWSNYELISTQWSTGLPQNCTANVQGEVYNGSNLVAPSNIQPQTPVTGQRFSPAPNPSNPTSRRSYLANTSMESYERSNCLGCHSKSTVNETGVVTEDGTDFVYFLGLEVPEI